MRIAIPRYEAPDNFEDNVAFTLRAMGHEVVTPSRRRRRTVSPLRLRAAELRETLFPSSTPPHEAWLLKLARSTRVDMVLALTDAISEQTLAELKTLFEKLINRNSHEL